MWNAGPNQSANRDLPSRENWSLYAKKPLIAAGKHRLSARHGCTKTFAGALISHARLCHVTKLSESRFGTKYQIDGPLPCPDGRSPTIRSVWIVDAGTDFPRLITAHPLESLQS
jgi:hypothetical protein